MQIIPFRENGSQVTKLGSPWKKLTGIQFSLVLGTLAEKVDHAKISKRGQQKLNFLILLFLVPSIILASRKKWLLGNVWKGNVTKMKSWPHHVLVDKRSSTHMNKANAESECKIKKNVYMQVYKVTMIQDKKGTAGSEEGTTLGKCWYDPTS